MIGRQGGRRLSIARRVAKAPGARSGRRPFHRSRETCGDRLGQVPRVGANPSIYACRQPLEHLAPVAVRACGCSRLWLFAPVAVRACGCSRLWLLTFGAAFAVRPGCCRWKCSLGPRPSDGVPSSQACVATGHLSRRVSRRSPSCPLSRRRSTVDTARRPVACVGHPSQTGRGPDRSFRVAAPSPGVPLFRCALTSRGRWGLLGFGVRWPGGVPDRARRQLMRAQLMKRSYMSGGVGSPCEVRSRRASYIWPDR